MPAWRFKSLVSNEQWPMETTSPPAPAADAASDAPERLRRAETVLQFRTGRLILVLEQCMDSHNHQAVLRTAEALGIQHVWLINANDKQVKKHKGGGKKIAKNCAVWLSVRSFASIAECVAALQEINCTVWATDLSPEAVALTSDARPSALPDRLAIVIGREIDGVSAEMLATAHRRVYFPIFGFSESLNLSVATALVVQRIFDWFPDIRGDLSDREKREIREQWLPHLVRNPTQAKQAAPWLEGDGTNTIQPLDDLRRDKLGGNDRWVPKSVKRREQDMPEVQERAGKRREAQDDSGEAQG